MPICFEKPYQYQTEAEKIKLGQEALATFEQTGLLRAARLEPLTLIG